jgi:hypothetical protein
MILLSVIYRLGRRIVPVDELVVHELVVDELVVDELQ